MSQIASHLYLYLISEHPVFGTITFGNCLKTVGMLKYTQGFLILLLIHVFFAFRPDKTRNRLQPSTDVFSHLRALGTGMNFEPPLHILINKLSGLDNWFVNVIVRWRYVKTPRQPRFF